MATPRKDWKKEWEETAKLSRKLAKRANQRMKRLEEYSKRPGYSNIKKYAYHEAESYIRDFLQKENERKTLKPRYKERVKLDPDLKGKDENDTYKLNVQKERLKIKNMQEFLSMASSTMGQSRSGPKTKGIKAIYDKRANTISERFLNKYGESMNADDLKRFFDSKKQAKLESEVGSSQMFIVACIIRKENIGGSRKELEEYVKTHVETNDPEELKMKPRESRAQYLDRMKDKLNYTNDKTLNYYITKALKAGIDANNIFI